MSSANISVGVVGVGVLGNHHARLYKECDGARLAGVFDNDPAAAAAAAKRHGVPAFDSIQSLAAEAEAISIAVPANLHHAIAMPLLALDRHLLVEKPIAVTVQEAGDMVKLAEERRRVLAVGHVERFSPVMSAIGSRSGPIRFIEAHRLAPYPPMRPGAPPRGTEVGVVLDLMIHDLDIILHLVDSEVERVLANGMPAISKTEDIANARIIFKNGCVANVTASRVTPYSMRKIRIFTADSCISLDYQKKSGAVFKINSGGGIAGEPIPVQDHNALKHELEDFVRAVRHANDTGEIPDPRVPGRHGLEALRLAIKIQETLHEFNKSHGFYDGLDVEPPIAGVQYL